MKKLFFILLVFLLCVPALAEPETAPGDVELFQYLGCPFEEMHNDIGGDLDKHYFEDGITVYPHGLAMTVRYTYDNADIKYGWPDETVFYISVSDAGYSLNGLRVGDTGDAVQAMCDAEGWTQLAEAPKYCDAGYEMTVEDVKYTMGLIFERGTDEISLVHIQAEKLAPAQQKVGWLRWYNIGG